MPSPGYDDGSASESRSQRRFKEGDRVQGTVQAVNDFGVFLDVGASKEGFLPWKQVVGGSSPGAGDVLDVVVDTVDDKGRLTLASPGGKGRSNTTGKGRESRGEGRASAAVTSSIGGYIYDVALGVRIRKKGGKGDGKGAYSYPDGMPYSDLKQNDDVSGHITNVEEEGCWIDIGAMKDAFLSWDWYNGPSVQWKAGEVVEDLKILSVSGEEIRLRWDDEGIGSLLAKDWEDLFANGPVVPRPKEEDGGPVVGDNCCAIFGSLRSATTATMTRSRKAEEELDEPARIAEGRGGRGRGRLAAQERGGPGRGKGGAATVTEGKSGVVSGPEPSRARGRGRGRAPVAAGKGPGAEVAACGGAKGWGKGEGPAYEHADGYGSCAQSAEDRARSAPPARRQRLRPIEDVSIGEVVRGSVVGLSRAGATVDFGCAVEGIVPRALVTARCRKGQVIARLSVTGVDTSTGRITLEPLEDAPGEQND